MVILTRLGLLLTSVDTPRDLARETLYSSNGIGRPREAASASRHVYCLTVRIDMTRLLQSTLYSERSLLIGQLSSHPIGQPPPLHSCSLLLIRLHDVVESPCSSEAFSVSIL